MENSARSIDASQALSGNPSRRNPPGSVTVPEPIQRKRFSSLLIIVIIHTQPAIDHPPRASPCRGALPWVRRQEPATPFTRSEDTLLSFCHAHSHPPPARRPASVAPGPGRLPGPVHQLAAGPLCPSPDHRPVRGQHRTGSHPGHRHRAIRPVGRAHRGQPRFRSPQRQHRDPA